MGIIISVWLVYVLTTPAPSERAFQFTQNYDFWVLKLNQNGEIVFDAGSGASNTVSDY